MNPYLSAAVRERRMLTLLPWTPTDSSQFLRTKGIMKHISSHMSRIATAQRVERMILQQEGARRW